MPLPFSYELLKVSFRRQLSALLFLSGACLALDVLSQQIVQLTRECEAARGEVQPVDPDLTHPCIATPMPA
jgi:hypothetical protein